MSELGLENLVKGTYFKKYKSVLLQGVLGSFEVISGHII